MFTDLNSRFDGIVSDVVAEMLELLWASDKMVKAVLLPKSAAGALGLID